MTRVISDWNDAAADAYSHLNERKRGYSTTAMLSLVDDLAMLGTATQEQMIEKHGQADFILTTLAHVTTAVHGPGSVPKNDGWYSATDNPRTYHLHPAFAAAWKLKRRLPRET